jgi:CHAT domain
MTGALRCLMHQRSSPPIHRNVILFLTANPVGTTPLALEEECAGIEAELHITSARHDFAFRSRWAVTIDEMMRHLNELEPKVVHFSGHGSRTVVDVPNVSARGRPMRRGVPASAGILLRDEYRQPKHVTASALARMIGSAAPSTRLVVFNTCFSDRVADSLRGVVDCVVGMRGAIGDLAARAFAVSFYRALGYRRSVGNAVAQAVATLAAKQFPDQRLPVCVTRKGVSADKLILTR